MPARRLRSLDPVRGFEAAARHLSFTRAAAELHVTQSAVSRQIKSLEDELGVALFERRHRALELTAAGHALYRVAQSVMRQLEAATAELQRGQASDMVTVTTTVGFASLWLIPRLADFRRLHPAIDVRISAANAIVDLERDRIDVAIRYCDPRVAPAGALRLFGEKVFPVCSPELKLARGNPLKTVQDLRHHVLLHLEDDRVKWPWLSWTVWFEAMHIADIRPAGTLYFSQYDQMIQAAIEGQGVALGRSVLVQRLLMRRQLVAPFDQQFIASQEYFALAASAAATRPEVKSFIDWLQASARSDAFQD